MPDLGYVFAVLAISFTITFALRALPFAALGVLRTAPIVRDLSAWMPVGILGILAVSAFHGTAVTGSGTGGFAVVALGVTIAVHLLLRRNTLLSVGIGTGVYVALVNVF